MCLLLLVTIGYYLFICFVVVVVVLAAVNVWESEVACERVKQSFCNVVSFP